MKAVGIQWDTDGDKALERSLPRSMDIPEGMSGIEEISDFLSNATGFCHFGFGLVYEKPSELPSAGLTPEPLQGIQDWTAYYVRDRNEFGMLVKDTFRPGSGSFRDKSQNPGSLPYPCWAVLSVKTGTAGRGTGEGHVEGTLLDVKNKMDHYISRMTLACGEAIAGWPT